MWYDRLTAIKKQLVVVNHRTGRNNHDIQSNVWAVLSMDIPGKDPAYPIENYFTRARYKAPTTEVSHPAKHHTRSFGISA